MKRKLLLYLALATLTQCSRCKRDDPAPEPPKDPISTLPPETQTGAGTLGCLVNGDAFISPSSGLAFGEWITTDKLSISATKAGTRDIVNFSILLHGSLQDNQGFSLITQGPSGFPPAYTSGLNQFTVFYNSFIRSTGSYCYYDGRLIKSGRVDLVKFDPVARIAAGRFSFTLSPAPGGCDTLKVTAGRFDIKF